ncbi:hypothetical protein GCK72_003970 [Caenorhabditis remanei]|uniref:Sdz-33 F-box domain-containing protein n=1 Tax=Caenorhabditis remanei TaxID=31234 RepID=A0A6A5HB18_CAERE|nr:hypothetical protein GCK72_003970 [Caenorhabditis remanei]KAF1764024.1 hypothetical protein GCK72_003970 [Caenorhabditis remanei]
MCFTKIGSPIPSYPCTLCELKSLCISVSERIRYVEKSPFPILKLPNVPLELVTKMMNSNEIIKLSVCSYRLELFLRTHRYRIKGFHVHLSDRLIQFDMNESTEINSTYFENGFFLRRPIKEVVKMEQFCKSQTTEHNNYFNIQSFSPEASFKLYHHISSLFVSHPISCEGRISSVLSTPCVHWVFFNDELKIETIKRYLDTTLSQKCCKFTFRKGQMSKELLTEIMDKVPVTMALNIDSGIPLDFKHSNAFKYPVIQYTEARWATLDDLKSVRNSRYIELKTTNFDYEDLSQFLKYCVNCDDDMLELLTVGIREGLEYDGERLTDGLVTLQVHGYFEYYTKVKNTKNRQFVIARFFLDSLHRFVLHMTTADKNPIEFALLEMLEKKKGLEEELMEIQEAEDIGEIGGGHFQERNRRKREIEMEVEKLREEIVQRDTVGYVYGM